MCRGQVQLSCVKNCECEGGVTDAHSARDRISVIQWARREVSQHAACVVRLTVLPGTSSGEHKFKMVQMAITIRVQTQW